VSALIDHSRKFIFIHTPRCAGSSITEALAPNLKQQGDNLDPLTGIQRLGRYHRTANDIAYENPKNFNEYFTFAFVRNPWSWVVSKYFYAQSRPKHRFHKPATELDFKTFVKFFMENDKRDLRHFICSKNGKILVDHVARFENINEEFEFLKSKIDGKVDFPQLNFSKANKTKFQSMYDIETRDLLAKHFKKDIALFGYSFE
jgi:hypothetical protein